jgi:hypothetical protein
MRIFFALVDSGYFHYAVEYPPNDWGVPMCRVTGALHLRLIQEAKQQLYLSCESSGMLYAADHFVHVAT